MQPCMRGSGANACGVGWDLRDVGEERRHENGENGAGLEPDQWDFDQTEQPRKSGGSAITCFHLMTFGLKWTAEGHVTPDIRV